MKNLRTKLFIVIGVLVCVSLILNVSLYCSFNVFPNKLKVNTVELKDSKIPSSMNGVSILYFTDLEYGEYQTPERTDAVFKTIKNLHPDILIFGGDLYDVDYTNTEEDNWKMIDYFSSIEAPLGKFAVWGDFDTLSQERQDAIAWIFSASQVEILSDTVTKLTNQSEKGIHLLGMSLQPNYEIVVANATNSTYNLLVTHMPDTLVDSMLNLASINLALAGHSHGTQITFPVYGGYKTIEGASQINQMKAEDLNFEYEISNGIGCTNIDARLNATPELHYYILKSKK